MTEHPLDRFFNPRSVVVAGASNNIVKMGTIQLLNIVKGGFEGRVCCLHPDEESVLGLPTFRSAADLPFAPDLAVIIIPSRHVPRLVGELGARGVKSAVVISGGFRESGTGEGIALEMELMEEAEKHGMRLVGPNCIGIISPPAKFNSTVYPYRQPTGKVGLLSQSGTYVTQVQHYLKIRGWGFSRAISMGNSCDLDLCDGLDYLADDPATASIALYIEGFRDGRRFLRSASRAAAKKPVVAFYVGGTAPGARVSASHTGAMAGDGAVYSGAFRQAGVIEVHGIERLYAAANALAGQPPMRGPRVGIITNSGGPAASIADAVHRDGLSLPEFSPALQEKLRKLAPPTAPVKNPVDITFSLDNEAFLVTMVDLVLGSGEVDGVVIHGVIGSLFMEELSGMAGGGVPDDNNAFLDVIGESIGRSVGVIRRHGLPVVISAFWGMNEDSSVRAYQQAGIPCHLTPELAVDSLKALFIRGAIEKRPKTFP